ncbi:hypothetical protein D3C77_757160 [compost metagenome]
MGQHLERLFGAILVIDAEDAHVRLSGDWCGDASGLASSYVGWSRMRAAMITAAASAARLAMVKVHAGPRVLQA